MVKLYWGHRLLLLLIQELVTYIVYQIQHGTDNITDYGWVAWVDYFIQNDLIKTDKKEDFECLKELLLSGVFEMIQLDGICFVSDMPTYISRNNSGRLHNTENYSVTFKDGFGQYYINGRYISDDLFLKLKEDKYTIDDFTKESNEEVKSTCIAYLQEVKGDDFIINFFRDNLKEVNTYVDKKESKYLEGTTKGMNVGAYTLFKGNINGVNIAYVRCYCPSTDRMFFLGVNSEHTNAKDAIASLYRVPKKLCNEIKAINRQGERYSTNFTTNGLSLLKSMSKEDIEDLVSISGDNYFKK